MTLQREPENKITDEGVLTMAALGRLGRFGNQVFQYAFLRIAARVSGRDFQCSPWIGQALFGHNDPAVTASLTPMIEAPGPGERNILNVVPEFTRYIEAATGMKPRRVGLEAMTDPVQSGDLIGFFQWHTRAYRPHRDFFRSLFRPVDDLRQWIGEPVENLRSRGKTIVAIHLRAGDYRWLPQFGYTLVVPPRWWADWLDSVWHELDNPVLYLCGNDVGAVRKVFRKFKPLTADDLESQPPSRLNDLNVDFYRDFHVMTQSDVLGISNSSFSFSAAMLNERARTFVRPHWDFETRFTAFDPWDSEPKLVMNNATRAPLKSYSDALAVARTQEGMRGALATALLYYPAGMATLAAIRLKLAYGGGGIRGAFDFLRGVHPVPFD